MQKIPIRDYKSDEQIVEYVVVEENAENRLKSILDSASKFIVLTTNRFGLEKHFLFPVVKTERACDSMYSTIRYVVELPVSESRFIFLHIGLVSLIGGVKKLIWRERCVLQSTNSKVHLDILLFTKMEGIKDL